MKFSIFQNLMAVTIVLLCMHEEDALLLPFNKWVVTASKNLAKGVSIATAVVCICGLPSYSVAEEAPSLKSQLKAIQDVKVASQKLAIETAEQDLQTKELLYPEGRLIGRGIIKLIPESGDPKLFPYGLPDASSYDSTFSNEKATLFVLAVGRDGPPLAAQRILMSEITFPYAFEVLSEDLIFPYTKEAWLASSNSKDTIALTVIISPDNLLATPNAVERIGFALSEPIQVAGTFGRTTANINVNGKVDTKLYTEEEKVLLSGVDRELDRICTKGNNKVPLTAAAVSAEK